ncbi:MAG: c-type cytochrome [Bradyrhizobium sp.]
MTGPSLAGVVGRKAGGLQSFHRYSDALKRSGILWNAETLDAWLSNPAILVPGNDMRFPGMPNAIARRDLVAYLAEAGVASQSAMHMGGRLPDLKEARPEAKVKTIGYCDDTYTVRTVAGATLKFWEFNLRFKTDSSIHGPRKGEPVLVGQGMQGDRAQVVFANPAEIGTLIKSECP